MVVAVLILAGCGGETGPEASVPTSPATPTLSEPAGAETSPAPEGQGELADDYAFREEFSEVTDAWPDPAAFGDDGYTLAAGQTAPVPYQPPASALGALAEVGVVMPETGATTLTCDLGATGTVALELTAEGAWSVMQTTGGAATELSGGTLEPGQRGEPGELTAVRLLCSSSPDGLSVGVSLHGAGVTFVDGATGEVPASGPTWSISSTAGSDVVLDTVLVTLVQA